MVLVGRMGWKACRRRSEPCHAATTSRNAFVLPPTRALTPQAGPSCKDATQRRYWHSRQRCRGCVADGQES